MYVCLRVCVQAMVNSIICIYVQGTAVTFKMNIKFSTNLHASKMRSMRKLNQDILWHRKRLTACMMNFAICFVSITNYLTN